MAPFPVAKLVYLAVKQISKPVARVIKTRAKSNAFFRNYILLPPAQLYHKAEATVKLRILGIGKKSAVHVKKMDEDTAIELASEMLGEVIVFVVATATLYYEYRRQCRKDIVKEERQNDRLTELEEVIVALQGQITEQSSQIEQVKHLLTISNLNIPEKITDKKSGLVLRVERKNKQVDVKIV